MDTAVDFSVMIQKFIGHSAILTAKKILRRHRQRIQFQAMNKSWSCIIFQLPQLFLHF